MACGGSMRIVVGAVTVVCNKGVHVRLFVDIWMLISDVVWGPLNTGSTMTPETT